MFPYQGDRVLNAWHVNPISILGRALDTDIRLEDRRVSRQHARLEVLPGAIRVTDLESSHGTFVSGRSAGAHGVTAYPGSVLRIGRTLLLVVEDVDASAAPIHQMSANFLGLAHDVLAGPCLWDTWQIATRVATLTHPVLLVGESGSGKEVVARILHAARSVPGPFVVANAAALGKHLFGEQMADCTAAAAAEGPHHHSGAFRIASGGVLFLDEVGDLDLESQAALLRWMDQGGSPSADLSGELPVPTRVIAATSQDLQNACKEGRFRQDLLYRLSGISIRVPPLRARRTDIVAIAQSMIGSQTERLCLSAGTAEALLLASWEGNVRQLNNVVLQALVRALGAHSKQILPEHLSDIHASSIEVRGNELTGCELVNALTHAKGNASAAAKTLGVSRATLYNLFKRHGVDPRTARRKAG